MTDIQGCYFITLLMGCMAVLLGVLSFYAFNNILFTMFIIAFHLVVGILFFLIGVNKGKI